ncbi:hypothetical protein GCM10009836_61570 [Pseudonocardia ailaonensis]|uniref:Insertion element IS150 protein InsJ-like helix-turn-helix domain-containing protein n=1 Tax=Pseudonocardia ailaonensis TaxID=367279 RepID=A0ABN2NJX0_9PSEU
MLVELSVVEQRYHAVMEVLSAGAPVVEVAARYGVSRKTVHAWVRRYRSDGLAGLADRSHRPHHHPWQLAPDVEARICELRRAHQFAHAVLRNALSNAVREELVGRNAAKLVKMSNPEYDVGAGLDPIAARALLKHIADDRLFALYLCAMVLGMRRGELLGLTWDAVDLDGHRLVVR